jgi:peptidoglycan/LPS O-acetylase OafA/YrhL
MSGENPLRFTTMEMQTPDQALHIVSAKNHRFLFLDALRGIAALLIVLHHAPRYLGRTLPYYDAFLAVDLFFVLSGFVIAFSYENRLLHGLGFRSFVAARLIRLYPVYILGTTVGFLVLFMNRHATSAHSTNPSVPWHSILFGVLLVPDLFLSSKSLDIFPLDIPAWSLFGEILANILYGALVYWRLATSRILTILSVSSLFFLLVWVFRISGTVDLGSHRESFISGLARVGYSFFIGVLAYRIWRSSVKRPQFTGVLGWMMAAVICTLVVLALATPLIQSAAAQLAVIALLFPLLIYFGACVHLPHHWGKISAFLGEISYPLYLLHVPLFLPLYGGTFRRFLAMRSGITHFVIPILVPVYVLISWWVAKHYDGPVRRFLARQYNTAPVAVGQAR